LIVALDVPGPEQARRLVEELGGTIEFYKVGLELYAAAGMEFVRELLAAGKLVFLDLKFYDIGETVKRAVARVAESGAHLLTVHGSNEVMQAAVQGRGDSRLKLLGVTVLTSFDRQDLADLGYPCEVEDLVKLRTRNAIQAGMDGLVLSPLEVAAVRKEFGPGPVLVTPGVRSASVGAGDQKRVATPRQALQAGATYLVIGREITRAASPRSAATRILNDIAHLRSDKEH
jgi:orotidine-5'-phosphate decarboxylase (EC 4.1.1.23)